MPRPATTAWAPPDASLFAPALSVPSSRNPEHTPKTPHRQAPTYPSHPPALGSLGPRHTALVHSQLCLYFIDFMGSLRSSSINVLILMWQMFPRFWLMDKIATFAVPSWTSKIMA